MLFSLLVRWQHCCCCWTNEQWSSRQRPPQASIVRSFWVTSSLTSGCLHLTSCIWRWGAAEYMSDAAYQCDRPTHYAQSMVCSHQCSNVSVFIDFPQETALQPWLMFCLWGRFYFIFYFFAEHWLLIPVQPTSHQNQVFKKYIKTFQF